LSSSFIDQIPAGGLVVSCQASAGNPLRDAQVMGLMAVAAEQGGAVAVRANGPEDIARIRAMVSLPIIGINKIGSSDGVFITPTAESALEVVRAGATIIALDGTMRPRPGGLTLAQQLVRVRELTDAPIMADVDSLAAGLAARAAGADVVATTLSGYTGPEVSDEPDIDLISLLVAELDCPIVAEGRIRSEGHVRAAYMAGAHAVVVGTAITNPLAITRRLVSVIANARAAEGTRS
jgi:N-acylglucosamine-6-phosphate 2-epimerase